MDLDPVFEVIVDSINFPAYEIENNGQYAVFTTGISAVLQETETISIIKIIPKRKGIYMIRPAEYLEVEMNRAANCDLENPIYDLAQLDNIFNVTDWNPELLAEIPLPSNTRTSDYVPRLTAKKRIFWLKVID